MPTKKCLIMSKKNEIMPRKRPIYRKDAQTVYKINPDNTYISVMNTNLFSVVNIVKAELMPTASIKNVEFKSTKKEFKTAYNNALKELRK